MKSEICQQRYIKDRHEVTRGASPDERKQPAFTVKEVLEGWHAPGYRDPELHLMTDKGELHVRLTPQAFVELHNILCGQQACIDSNSAKPLDLDRYQLSTNHIAVPRSWETVPVKKGTVEK